MKERWKRVAGFPDYMMSNKGIVCKLPSWKVLSQSICPAGYSTVSLSYRGKRSLHKVHRLLSRTFMTFEARHVVVFLDGDQSNIEEDNLICIPSHVNRARLRQLKRAPNFPGATYFTIIALAVDKRSGLGLFYRSLQDAEDSSLDESLEYPEEAELTHWPVYDLTQTRGAKLKALTSILKNQNLKNDFTP